MAGTFIPNRIVLICRGRREEYNCDVACLPGHLLELRSDNGVAPHTVKGGNPGLLAVAEEDALQGKTTVDAYVVGNPVFTRHPAKGDVLLMRLLSGQSVAEGAQLMSNGDGTLTAATTLTVVSLLNNVADSSAVTNTAAETTFSTGTLAIPANSLSVGDVLHIRGAVIVTAQNSTNTNRVKVKIGTTVIADSGAVALAANDVVEFDVFVTIRTIGASGTLVAEGTVTAGTPGTATETPVVVASTAIDTTAIQTVTVTDTQSAASAGNSAKLSQLLIDNRKTTVGGAGLFTAKEAVNNTGLLPFIRVLAN